MPELPEVDTIRKGLGRHLADHPTVKKVRLLRADIRFPIPKELPKLLAGQPITSVRRRAKYLLFDTPAVMMLSHLGMTGSWRLMKKDEADDKHDHCIIEFSDGRRLAFRDPRRFGILDLVKHGEEETHPRLKHLGHEPFDEKFTGEELCRLARKRSVVVKVFIMDQKIVVGVGNIYASEALFRAGIHPKRKASSLKLAECEKLVKGIREVLHEAIAAGGSSIRDYRQTEGESGSFQEMHKVYDRAGQACRVCGSGIKSEVLGGRSTYWCPKCQKKIERSK